MKNNIQCDSLFVSMINRDLENSFESIKMSGADIVAAFDKHKANKKETQFD